MSLPGLRRCGWALVNLQEAFDDVLAFGVGITTLCSIKAVDGKSGDAGQPRVGAWPYI